MRTERMSKAHVIYCSMLDLVRNLVPMVSNLVLDKKKENPLTFCSTSCDFRIGRFHGLQQKHLEFRSNSNETKLLYTSIPLQAYYSIKNKQSSKNTGLCPPIHSLNYTYIEQNVLVPPFTRNKINLLSGK